MKKSILLILMFITMFFAGSKETNALTCKIGDAGCTQETVQEHINSKGNAQLLCLYEVEVRNSSFYTYIYYNGKDYFGGSTLGIKGGDQKLTAKDKWLKNENVWVSNSALNGLKQDYVCPTASYLTDNKNNNGTANEVCFDNGTGCKDIKSSLKNTAKYNLAINNAKILQYNELTIGETCDANSDKIPSGYKACGYSNEQTQTTITLLYNGQNNIIIYENFNSGKKFSIKGYDNNYKEINGKITTVRENKVSNEITSCPSSLYVVETNEVVSLPQDAMVEEFFNYYTITDKITENAVEYKPYNCNSEIIVKPSIDKCEDLINEELREIIDDIMTIIRIAVPILLIGLLIYDFAMAIFAGDDKAVNKAKSNAIKRVIIAVIIFFVPTFINLMFNIVNEVWETNFQTCGIENNTK